MFFFYTFHHMISSNVVLHSFKANTLSVGNPSSNYIILNMHTGPECMWHVRFSVHANVLLNRG